jgi:imidazolonepropionase-like amidohydrolase
LHNEVDSESVHGGKARVKLHRALALLLTLVVGGCAPERGEDSAATTLFEGARVITGDGSPPIEDGAFVVRNGRIVEIGGRGAIEAPSEAARVDLSGKTVMPMMVNVHGHVGYLRGSETGREHYSRENVLDHLRRSSYYGVGAVQSLGTDRDGIEIAIRDEQRTGALNESELALLLTAGNGVVAPTPGSTNGGPSFATDVVLEAASPDEGRRQVRRLAETGADIVKLWVDDRGGTKTKLQPDVYRAAIIEAHEQGLRAVAHVYYLDDAKELVRSGVDGFAHMVRAEPGADAELVAMIGEADLFQCTAMSLPKRLVDDPSWLDDPALAETVRSEVLAEWKSDLEGAAPEALERGRSTYRGLEASLRRLHAGGVRIVLCADTGLFSQAPGFTEHRELEAMVQAGMPALDAIRAATRTGAEVLGLHDRGSLAAGMRADFIVLDANPLERIANSRRISAVYRDGQPIDRAALRERWAGGS